MGEADVIHGGGGGGGPARGRAEQPEGAAGGGGGGGRRRRRPRSPEEEAPPAAVQAVAAAAAGVEGAVRMAGYLEKRGRRRLVATWRRHWFVLQGRLLLRYRSRRDYLALASCRGALNLGLASAVRPGPPAAGGAIEVVTRSQVVTLRARDKALRERWLAALLDAARGSSCNSTPTGSGGGAAGTPGHLGSGPVHFRYSLDHLPALYRHDPATGGCAGAANGSAGGSGAPAGGAGGAAGAGARRSLSLEAVVPCAAARPRTVHPSFLHSGWAHPHAHPHGYGGSVVCVRGRYDDDDMDAAFIYSSCDRNVSRGAVGGGSQAGSAGAMGGGVDEDDHAPRSASASTAASTATAASTTASGASSAPAKPKRKGLKLRLRRRNNSETESVCDGVCSEPKRRPSFLERVLTSVRGGNGGGGSRAASPLPAAARAVAALPHAVASAALAASPSPSPPPGAATAAHSDPDYDSVPTTTVTADGEQSPSLQRDATLEEDEDESSSGESSSEGEEDGPEGEGMGAEGAEGTRVGAAGLVGSASLLPKPALVELRQRLRRRAESARDSDLSAVGDPQQHVHPHPHHNGHVLHDDDDSAVFEGYEGFAELRRRWRERASDLAAGIAPASPAAAAGLQSPAADAPPPLPRKQRAAIAAAVAAAEAEAAAAAAAAASATRASQGGKVREMATHFEAVASTGTGSSAACRRSDELGALLAQLAELTAAPLPPGPGMLRPPVPGAAAVAASLSGVQIRPRRDSDPDYDIPRPHGAALGLASRTPVASNAIDASPFLGGGVHRAFAHVNVNIASSHGGDDSTDDGDLSWTGLSMAPDSLEPVPVRLLDATG